MKVNLAKNNESSNHQIDSSSLLTWLQSPEKLKGMTPYDLITNFILEEEPAECFQALDNVIFKLVDSINSQMGVTLQEKNEIYTLRVIRDFFYKCLIVKNNQDEKE